MARRYTSDYSRWDEWRPSDPATKEEEEQVELEKERIKNEEFEKANAEFCDQVCME